MKQKKYMNDTLNRGKSGGRILIEGGNPGLW